MGETTDLDLWTTSPAISLRVRDGFQLESVDRAATVGWPGSKKEGNKARKERGDLLDELQERLIAEARSGQKRRVLLVLQGMDTAGKGSLINKVAGMVDPQGVEISSFGVPTQEEASHDFLWRIEKRLPKPGMIGIFDRSHYEDVLVQKVENLAPPEEIERRYGAINDFEKSLVDDGVTVIKIALLISYQEQGYRLLRRLARRDKHWKYSPSDVATREKWSAYDAAYQAMFERTSTDYAPWYAVPADNKWYARLAVTEILTQKLAKMAPRWPEMDWDVEAEAKKVLETIPAIAAQAAQKPLEKQAAKVAEESKIYREAVFDAVRDDATRDGGDRVANV